MQLLTTGFSDGERNKNYHSSGFADNLWELKLSCWRRPWKKCCCCPTLSHWKLFFTFNIVEGIFLQCGSLGLCVDSVSGALPKIKADLSLLVLLGTLQSRWLQSFVLASLWDKSYPGCYPVHLEAQCYGNPLWSNMVLSGLQWPSWCLGHSALRDFKQIILCLICLICDTLCFTQWNFQQE